MDEPGLKRRSFIQGLAALFIVPPILRKIEPLSIPVKPCSTVSVEPGGGHYKMLADEKIDAGDAVTCDMHYGQSFTVARRAISASDRIIGRALGPSRDGHVMVSIGGGDYVRTRRNAS